MDIPKNYGNVIVLCNIQNQIYSLGSWISKLNVLIHSRLFAVSIEILFNLQNFSIIKYASALWNFVNLIKFQYVSAHFRAGCFARNHKICLAVTQHEIKLTKRLFRLMSLNQCFINAFSTLCAYWDGLYSSELSRNCLAEGFNILTKPSSLSHISALSQWSIFPSTRNICDWGNFTKLGPTLSVWYFIV